MEGQLEQVAEAAHRAAQQAEQEKDALSSELAQAQAAHASGISALHFSLAAATAEAEASLAAIAQQAAALQQDVAARDHALRAAAEEVGQLQAELADREQLFSQHLAAAQGQAALAGGQAQGPLAGAAADSVVALQAQLAAAEMRHAGVVKGLEGQVRGLETAQELMMRRMLTMEGDEEATRALSSGGLQALLRGLEATCGRVRKLLADRWAEEQG